MKYIGAKYGNKNVKMIFGGKMFLCSDEIYWGKIATTNLPLRPQTTHRLAPCYISLQTSEDVCVIEVGTIRDQAASP